MQNQLRKLPPGTMFITRNDKRFKWYFNDGKKISYLPKAQRKRAEELARKKYLTMRVNELTQEKKALDLYLQHHSKIVNSSEKLLDNSPFQELLKPYFKSTTKEILEWTEEPFEKNDKYLDQLIYKSISGNIVRSKSETIIDMSLYLHKIPFRYECALWLGDAKIHPDFTILHPTTRKIYYWEHFGMMDDPGYAKNACSKLQLYTSNNIIPGANLITTFETQDQPLTAEYIEKVIRFNFL